MRDGQAGGGLTTYRGLLSAGAYMRSLWEGGGDEREVTLSGWREEEEEKWRRDRERDSREDEHWGQSFIFHSLHVTLWFLCIKTSNLFLSHARYLGIDWLWWRWDEIIEEKRLITWDFRLFSNSLQPPVSSFTNISDRKRQQILTSQRLEAANVWHFCLKNDWNYKQIIQKVDDTFYFDWLINNWLIIPAALLNSDLNIFMNNSWRTALEGSLLTSSSFPLFASRLNSLVNRKQSVTVETSRYQPSHWLSGNSWRWGFWPEIGWHGDRRFLLFSLVLAFWSQRQEPESWRNKERQNRKTNQRDGSQEADGHIQSFNLLILTQLIVSHWVCSMISQGWLSRLNTKTTNTTLSRAKKIPDQY